MLAGVTAESHNIKVKAEVLLLAPGIVGIRAASVAALMTSDFHFGAVVTRYILNERNFTAAENAFSQKIGIAVNQASDTLRLNGDVCAVLLNCKAVLV